MPRKKKLNKNLTDNATSNKSPTIDEQFKQEEKFGKNATSNKSSTIDEQFKQEEKLEKNANSYKTPTIDELFKQEEKFGKHEFKEKYKFIFSNDEIFDAQRMQEIESYSDSIEIENKTETLNYIILEEKKNSNENNVNIDINVQQKPIFKILNKKLGRRKKKGNKSVKHTKASYDDC